MSSRVMTEMLAGRRGSVSSKRLALNHRRFVGGGMAGKEEAAQGERKAPGLEMHGG
jgi:hypothetical protein